MAHPRGESESDAPGAKVVRHGRDVIFQMAQGRDRPSSVGLGRPEAHHDGGSVPSTDQMSFGTLCRQSGDSLMFWRQHAGDDGNVGSTAPPSAIVRTVPEFIWGTSV